MEPKKLPLSLRANEGGETTVAQTKLNFQELKSFLPSSAHYEILILRSNAATEQG